MSWSDSVLPVRMQRIALVAPADGLRDLLVRVAATGKVDVDHGENSVDHHETVVALAAREPDPAALVQTGRADLAAGENQLRLRRDAAVHRRAVVAVSGWCPKRDMAGVSASIESVPAALVPLSSPPGVDPPTLLRDSPRLRRAFAPLVGLYGVVPYRDIDPSIVAGPAYAAMFGMMFGDAGHGLLLLAAALVLRSGRIRRLASLRRLWVFVAGAGSAAIVFGLLYGEFFGPTGVLPVLWLQPLEEPDRLLVAAVAAGAGLLAAAYGLGVANRWREGGLPLALYAASGVAGAATFLGLAVLTTGALIHDRAVGFAGAGLTAAGLTLSMIGAFTESGGGPTGVARAGVGLMDLVMHIVANLVSFARLAAFGMTHAALGQVIWHATVATGAAGTVAGVVTAVAIFSIGNVLAFALEALVAAVQALRLEFYELFSRVFVDAGRSFRPWRVTVVESAGVS
ncbi:V-type ATPase 116kDa subunit family protein [Nocardia sp. NPDC003963]